MRVFVAGSTGVLGRAVVRQLRARRHQVVALVRNGDKAKLVRDLGAEPVVGDLLDVESFRQAAAECDAVMHLATAIPKKSRPSEADWGLNDRLRREGTRNLIEAVRGQNLRAYIQQSVAFLYGDRGGEWIREDMPTRPNPILQSAIDGEQLVLEAYRQFRLPAVVLRGASFYGPECWNTRSMLDSVKHRQFPVIGNGEQYWHWIHVEDMAAATICAAENPVPGEVMFVADDWPFHSRDLIDYLSVQFNSAAAPRLPLSVAWLLMGRQALMLAQSTRFRTDKIKRMIGWSPRYPTYRDGFAEILPRLGARPK